MRSLAAGHWQPAAATTWYFAEGATGVFHMYLLIENPNATPATVTMDYLRSRGGAITHTVAVPAFARQTIDVNAVPGVEAADVAVALSSDVPIVAERSMYLSVADRVFDAGTAGLGATALGTSWHFAEGVTGFFDTFLLFGNPGHRDAHVSVAYHLPDGTTIATSHVVRARSRLTLPVAGEDPTLSAAVFAMAVTSDQPLVAERAVWWGVPWYEGNVSQGTLETGVVWAIGEGAEGGPASESTFVLVSNGAAHAGQVRLTVVHDDGTTAQKAYALPGNARLTIRVLDDFANTLDHRFSLLVESLDDGGGDGVPLTVECARYQSASGRFGEAGGVALATRIR